MNDRLFRLARQPIGDSREPSPTAPENNDDGTREHLENAIRAIARGVSVETGEAFFHSLVRCIATVLGMDFVALGELQPGQRRVKTLAVFGEGRILDNFEYDLAGTPCERVLNSRQVCYYPDRIQQRFPGDDLLGEMGIESYLGVPLIDSRGECIGLLAVLNRQARPEGDLESEILQIFAARATAELERQRVLDSLQEMNERLESRVEERTQELSAAIERLKEEIEERSRVEAALRESEERYRNLVNLLPYGVQECDVTGTIVYANPASDRMYGLPPGSLIGTRIWERLLREEDRRVLQKYLQFLNQEQPLPTPYYSTERTISGEAIDVQIDWTYLRDKRGQLTGYLSILSDITDRRRAEVEIQTALDKARESDRLKTDFMNIASHEFRTPLTVILGSIQFLIKRYSQLSDERRLEHFQRIRSAGMQIRELIEEMLTAGRADFQYPHPDTGPLDLVRFGREVIEEIRLGSGNQHFFSLKVENLPDTVTLDRKLLHHILTNLLFNAVKYSGKGSRVDLIIEGRGDRVLFTVVDRGIGIPAEDSERIFDSFHRGGNVGDIPGTGLGLKIAKKYVEALNGTISFTSQIGRGSSFLVSLPITGRVP